MYCKINTSQIFMTYFLLSLSAKLYIRIHLQIFNQDTSVHYNFNPGPIIQLLPNLFWSELLMLLAVSSQL